MGANARRRKAVKLAVHVTAHPDKLCRAALARCIARDADGHRCRFAPHEKGNHRSFGREWKS